MRYLNISLKRAAGEADYPEVSVDRDAAQRAVEELIAHYEARARAVSRTAVAVGAFVGTAVGAIPLSPLRAAWPIPSGYGFATLLGGLVVGVLVGYVIGDPRGKLYQRMADQARLQLQLDRRISQNDARMAQLLTALTARAAAAAQATPPPQPAPVAAPHDLSPPPRLRTVPPPVSADPPAPAAATAPPLSPPLTPGVR
jgi:hypothetical protein